MSSRSVVMVSLLVTTSTLTAACGGRVLDENAGGSTGDGGSAQGTHGDCATDADCSGGTCAAVTPGGYQICLSAPPEATGCTQDGPVPDECCASSDCVVGKCYSTQSVPYCGGAYPAPYNACIEDACDSDADCGALSQVPMICAPAGAFGQPMRACVAAGCHTDADCDAAPGGVCRPVADVCCATPQAITCVYPDGCASDADCSPGEEHCEVGKDGEAVCVAGVWGCPA